LRRFTLAHPLSTGSSLPKYFTPEQGLYDFSGAPGFASSIKRTGVEIMKFKILFLTSLLVLPSAGFARDTEEVTVDQVETIVRRADLAVHMGVADQEIVFGSPRNFRSESLNQNTLEPLDPNSEEAKQN
jgi:hypothetical protein